MMIEAYGRICIYLVTWTIGLIFLAAIDVLDFHWYCGLCGQQTD